MSTTEEQAAELQWAARQQETAALTPSHDALARACAALAAFERTAPS
jgi:hypothetical protein